MLILKETEKGKGIFTVGPIRKGTKFLRLRGPRLTQAQLKPGYETEHSIQIGPDLLLGPSGELDDFVNHSCDPNSGVLIVGMRAEYVAIRDIPAGEEITYDYSTTMSRDPWQMKCACGADACRGIIGEFRSLPDKVQSRYVALGVVPWYCVGYVIADSYLP
jgi:SET domain-containing protein